MNKKKVLPYLFILLICLAFTSCHTAEMPAFARNNACVNNPVRDTLFITLRDYEDQWVNVRIKSNDTDFVGRDQVRNGRVWFDIRRLPTAYYTVQIEVMDLSFLQHIWHERTF
ncbi:MAG: hypothetical protein WCR53_03810 [Bacteroidaceae bacterium]|jgi:hypothetical protein|nr:hypothetical protein [Bacteroidaceae bacterium]